MNPEDPYQKPDCWHAGGFYFNREDPRLIVPKRFRKLGWTMNFAKPMAIPLTVAIIIAVLAPIKLLSILGIYSKKNFYITALIETIALSAFCSWMANPKRFESKEN